ncbi:hypothetical protein ACFL17_08760 [Pseudomonadota bacterium]
MLGEFEVDGKRLYLSTEKRYLKPIESSMLTQRKEPDELDAPLGKRIV